MIKKIRYIMPLYVFLMHFYFKVLTCIKSNSIPLHPNCQNLMKLLFQQNWALLFALKNNLPFCVWSGPHYLLFLQLKPSMAKTRSNEQCVGHRGRAKEKKKERREKSTTTKARVEYLLTSDV